MHSRLCVFSGVEDSLGVGLNLFLTLICICWRRSSFCRADVTLCAVDSVSSLYLPRPSVSRSVPLGIS